MENQPKSKETRKNKDKDSNLAIYAKYTGIAFQMLGIILLFVWAGLKLDEKYPENEPLFLIIFSLCGVFIALYTSLRDFIKFKK